MEYNSKQSIEDYVSTLETFCVGVRIEVEGKLNIKRTKKQKIIEIIPEEVLRLIIRS
jgi:hypothetical protein